METLSVGCFRFELLFGIFRFETCVSDLSFGSLVWELLLGSNSFCLRLLVWLFTFMDISRIMFSRSGVFAWELQLGNSRLKRCPWTLQIRTFVSKCSMRAPA